MTGRGMAHQLPFPGAGVPCRLFNERRPRQGHEMIRIRMLNGETVETSRHTYGQAIAARAAGVGIEVGGVDEDITWVPGDDEASLSPVRTLYPEGIASIEDVSE